MTVDVVVAVVLTLTRIFKSVVTGQAPVTLEWRNAPGKKTQTKAKVVHANTTADATHASARNVQNVESEVSLRCARPILVHTSHYSRLKIPTTPVATQKILPGIYYTWYLSLPIPTSDSSQLEKKEEKKRQERQENRKKNGKGKENKKN